MSFRIVVAPVVIDASVAVGSVLGDPPAEAALRAWATEGRTLLAPAVFWVETANALVRRRKLSAVDASGLLSMLSSAGIEVADRGLAGVEAAVVLANRHTLSVYDATYLWLAIDTDGELATFDRALIRAAGAEGVELAIQA